VEEEAREVGRFLAGSSVGKITSVWSLELAPMILVPPAVNPSQEEIRLDQADPGIRGKPTNPGQPS